MTGWQIFGISVLGLFAGYTAVCIFVPEIRMDWRWSNKRLGTLSSIGLATFVWSPTLRLMGIIPSRYGAAVYFIALLGLLIAGVGYLLDVIFPLDE